MAGIVVIGAGISGAAAAWELARGGEDVVLVDRYAPAMMASGWTLAGVRQSGRHPAELPLAMAAVDRWQTLGEELDADVAYRRCGNVRLARTADEVGIIEALVAEQAATGLDIHLLRGRAIQKVAPQVAESVLAASWCPTDGCADPARTVAAFVRVAARAGAKTRFGEKVLSVDVRSGRVVGVTTDKGKIPADRVVVAAGIFSDELVRPLGYRIPLDVQMVTMIRSMPMEIDSIEPVIGVANADIAGRREVDGRWRLGSGVGPWNGSYEEGERPVVRPTMGMVEDVLRRFGEIVPGFRATAIESFWGGLIDMTPDALPVLDAPAGTEGLVIGAGFSGHGFCLGPVTGSILASLARGCRPALPIEAFAIDRFAGADIVRQPMTLHG